MKRRILLVDDEVAVLLTLKAVLEISGFDVDTAASAREGVSKLHTREYDMLITDMRMEHDEAGIEVIRAARSAAYHPAVALLTAFPVADEDWQEMGADQLLVKPMHTRILLEQIELLLISHRRRLEERGMTAVPVAVQAAVKKAVAKRIVKKAVKKAIAKKILKKVVAKKVAAKVAKKAPAKTAKKVAAKVVKKAVAKKVAAKAIKKAVAKKAVKKAVVKKAVKKVVAKKVVKKAAKKSGRR